MLAGELYDAGAPELQMELAATHRWLVRYNAALDASAADRRELLLERLAAVGEGAVIRPPFHCDYGFNIRLGAGIFLNFNCVILDVVEVSIGDKTQIGPAVQILAADHPRDAVQRAAGRGPGVWPSRSHRMQCVDRRRRHHPAGRQHRRRCAHRCRQRSHARHSRRRCRFRQPGTGADREQSPMIDDTSTLPVPIGAGGNRALSPLAQLAAIPEDIWLAKQQT